MNKEKQIELISEGEEFVIKVIRIFDFLKKYYFSVSDLSTYGKEIYVNYSSKNTNRGVDIVLDDNNRLYVEIKKTNGFMSFSKKKNYLYVYELASKFSIEIPTKYTRDDLESMLEKNAMFIKNNLIPIVNGKKWV